MLRLTSTKITDGSPTAAWSGVYLVVALVVRWRGGGALGQWMVGWLKPNVRHVACAWRMVEVGRREKAVSEDALQWLYL